MTDDTPADKVAFEADPRIPKQVKAAARGVDAMFVAIRAEADPECNTTYVALWACGIAIGCVAAHTGRSLSDCLQVVCSAAVASLRRGPLVVVARFEGPWKP